ncbi:cation efflux family-domain-containing protein [Blakeslea trispora]|nr:cation efflux family-domain-containing protein [Blakeslea trispora]
MATNFQTESMRGIAIQSSAPIYAQRQHKAKIYKDTNIPPLQHIPIHPIDTHHHDITTNSLHHHHDRSHHHDDNTHCHNHAHSFSPVYTKPLPSWIQIFSNLLPAQKTIFTWFLFHFSIGICLYCMGLSRGSLSFTGYAYLMLFDALGVLNLFISSILRSNPEFGNTNTKRPFGAHRYEIVFALGTTIYLLFGTMHNTKESLEHFFLQGYHHGELHGLEDHSLRLGLSAFLLLGVAISATCLSSITLGNHDSFVRYLRKRPTNVHDSLYNGIYQRVQSSQIHTLLSNIYSSWIALCGIVVLIFHLTRLATPLMDKVMALSESAVMFCLGYPTAKSLANVLLQTTPITVQHGVMSRVNEILQNPNVLQVERIHFWETTFGKCVGTVEIRVHPEVDEHSILQWAYEKLEGLTVDQIQTENETSYYHHDLKNELTVSIVK